MKDKIDTLKKWFKPFWNKKNKVLIICSIIVVILITLLGILARNTGVIYV